MWGVNTEAGNTEDTRGFEAFAFDEMRCVLSVLQTQSSPDPAEWQTLRQHGIFFGFISPSCWSPVETWPLSLRNLPNGRGGVHSIGR